jgi:hypothetical protein
MTTLPMTYADQTISHATLLSEDLASKFLSVLSEVEPARAGALRDAFDAAAIDEQDDVLATIHDALNAVAPPGTSFGAHPGDGSDFGFWSNEPEETFENVTTPGGRSMVTLTDAAADELTGVYAVTLFRCGSCFIVGLAPNTQDVQPPERPDFVVTLSDADSTAIPGSAIICTTCGCNADGPSR